jgi:hypothetical protein
MYLLKSPVSGQKRLNDSSEEVANAISDVITAAGVLPGADKAKMGDTTEDTAEAELIAAANAIEEAAATLRTAMPVKKVLHFLCGVFDHTLMRCAGKA